MRIFLTGGTGFIGSHFLKQALSAGHEVIALRRATSRPRIPLPAEPVWFDGDLGTDLSQILPSCDAIVHLAAVGVSPQKADWETLLKVNVLQTQQLFLQAAAAGVLRWVIAGSCLEYGRSAERYDTIPATAPLEPVEPYGASKAAAFAALHALAVERSAELLYLRIFSVYGDGQFEKNFWPSLRKAAHAGHDFPMTQGRQIRDFISVEDLATHLLTAVERADIPAGHPWVRNIGSSQALRLSDFAAQWWEKWQATGQLKLGAVPERAHEIMQFIPQVTDDLIAPANHSAPKTPQP